MSSTKSGVDQFQHAGQRQILANAHTAPPEAADIPALGADEDSDDHELEELASEVPEGFLIDDEQKASWAVRKIVEARAYGSRVRAWAERESRRAERDEQWFLRRFGPELEAWLRSELQRRGDRQRSVPLPAGTVGLRRQPARLELIDEATAATWCELHLPTALAVSVHTTGSTAIELARWHQQHDEDARLTRSVLKNPLNRYVSDSGELPEGATLTDARDKLYVK